MLGFLFRSCYNDGKYEGASMKKNQLNISLAVGFISMSCATSLFLSQNSFADDIVTDVAVDVPAACTIAGTVDTPHTREMESGTYREDIGTTTFKVICNDNSGFSVYAVGYSNEKIGNNKMLATVSGELAPSFDIVTGTASSGSTSKRKEASGLCVCIIWGILSGCAEAGRINNTFSKTPLF